MNVSTYKLQNLAKLINRKMPKNTGFVLLTFPVGAGIASYVSNIEKQMLLTKLKETVAQLEQKEDIKEN